MSASPEVMQDRILRKRYFFGAHPSVALGIILIVVALSLGDTAEIIPLFAPMVASPFFQFFHEIHDLLAIGVAVYGTYKYSFRLGTVAMLLYLAAHIPYAIIRFPDNILELEHTLVATLGAILCSWLINQLHKTGTLVRQTQEHLQFQVERMPIGLIVWDTNFRVQSWNPAAESIFGFSCEEALEKHPYDLIVPKGAQPQVDDVWQKLLEGDMTAHSINDNTTKDGRTILCDWLNTPLRGDDGQVLGVLSMVQDITERKKTEKEAFLNSERYRVMLKTAMDGVWRVDLQGRITEVNDAYCEMSGYSEQELLTMSISDLEAKESAKDTVARIQNIITVGQERFTTKHRRKDGSIYPVEVSVQYQAYGDESLVVFIRDITESKQAQETLERSAKEWESTFDSITDPISIHDMNRRLIRVNKAFAAAFSKTKEELAGKHCYELVHGTDRPPAYCPHEKTLNQKKTTVVEEFEPHLNAWLQISTSPIFNEKGEVVGTVHATRDITQVKQIQEQLMAQDRLVSIGQLVSGVAHEINNPMTSVVGFSDLLLQRDLPPDIKADIEIINFEAKRTTKIVQNLLTFSRQRIEGKVLINIQESIDRVITLRSHEEKVNNIQTKTQYAPELPQIIANSAQLQQVFFNLIVNAEQAMIQAHNKGTLTITTEKVGKDIRISFADDGPGISPEDMKKLFTPFFTTKEVGKGTGLGLSISHGIIKDHGGRIYATSEPGKGTTFIVELPINNIKEQVNG